MVLLSVVLLLWAVLCSVVLHMFPVTYLTSLIILIMCARAPLILSSFLLAVKACSVDGTKVFLNSLWWWFRNAGSPSDSVHTSLGLFPNASWKGEKTATFYKPFLALKAQVRASSGEQLVSEIILSIMLASVRLFFSTVPLLHRDSAAVILMFIPK